MNPQDTRPAERHEHGDTKGQRGGHAVLGVPFTQRVSPSAPIDLIEAEIIEGTFADALWQSWGANRSHGLRRTQREKRRIIRAALQHPQWCGKSDRAIARQVGCDHKTVGAIRSILRAGEIPTCRTQTTVRARKWFPKNAVPRACRLLTEIQPQQVCRFDETELAVAIGGYEALRSLLIGAQPQAEAAPGSPSMERTQS